MAKASRRKPLKRHPFVSHSRWCQAQINLLTPTIGTFDDRHGINAIAKRSIVLLTQRLIEIGLGQYIGHLDPLRFNCARLAIAELQKFKSLFDDAVEKSNARQKQPAAPVPTSDAIAESRPTPDGPAPPNLIRFSGRTTSVQPVPWHILTFMWNRDAALIDDVCRAVWRDSMSDVADSAVINAIQKVNRALERLGIEWRLGVKAGYVVKKYPKSIQKKSESKRNR